MKKAIASLVFIVIMASFTEAQIKVLIVDGQIRRQHEEVLEAVGQASIAWANFSRDSA